MKTVKLSMDGEGDVWLDLQDAQTGRKAGFNLRWCVPSYDTDLCAEIMGEMLDITFVEPGAPQEGPARSADLTARLEAAEAMTHDLDMRDAIIDLSVRLAAAEEKNADYEADYKATLAEACGGDDKQHCACVPHLRRRIAELEAEVARLGGEVS